MNHVTVIIPAYNAAGSIGTSIDSALAQTHPALDVLVIDDGSTDGTAESLRERYGVSGRVEVISQTNGGPAKARNKGIREARGQYVLILDADDLLPEDSVERQLAAIEAQPGALWAVIDIIRRKAGEPDQYRKGWLPSDGTAMQYAFAHRFPFRAVFYDKLAFEIAGMHSESIRSTVDWDMHCKMLTHGVPFAYVDAPCYIYCIQDESVTKTGNDLEKRLRHLRNMERIFDLYYKPLAHENRTIKRAYVDEMWWLAGHYKIEGAPHEYFQHAVRSIRKVMPLFPLRLLTRKLLDRFHP